MGSSSSDSSFAPLALLVAPVVSAAPGLLGPPLAGLCAFAIQYALEYMQQRGIPAANWFYMSFLITQ